MMFSGLNPSSCGPWSKGPATSQSCYPYLPTNRKITLSLTFNPIPLLQQYIISVPWCLQLNLFSSDGKNPRNTAFSSSCVVSEWHHSYTRESDAAHSAAKGGRFLPPKKMPVPPSGPSKQHNSVPRLRFIPATVVYGSKRLVPSGSPPSLV